MYMSLRNNNFACDKKACNATDDDLELETNLHACKTIADVAREFQKPLTDDLQDEYGDHLEEAISRLIKMGVVGINLKDCNNTTRDIYSAKKKKKSQDANQASTSCCSRSGSDELCGQC